MSDDSLDKLARKLAEAVPQGLRSVRDDLEKNFRAVLKSGLDRLDLVTREEFEVQEAVLAHTREKLETLVARLEKMEAAATPKPVRKKKSKTKAKNKKTKMKTGKGARKKSSR